MSRKAIGLSLLILPLVALAQGGPGHGPGMRRGMHGPGAKYMHLFDPATIATVEGEVVKLTTIPHKRMNVTGTHATVKTSEGELDVHLGPSWYLDNQELKLQAKDKVSVTGSRVTVDGKPAIIATEVKRGNDTLKLREADGTPLWVAWRQAAASP